MKSVFSHVALLVPSVEISARFLNTFGIKTQNPEVFESEGTKEVYAGSYDSNRGLLLLMEAHSEGPYKRALEKRGPSLHHIGLDVENMDEIVTIAKEEGWQVHPLSETSKSSDTVWLYLKGVPTLIELHQKKTISAKPLQVSRIALPIQSGQLPLFECLGLGDIIYCNDKVIMTIEGKTLDFDQIAGLL